MSRSYRILAAAVVGMLVLVGLVRIADREGAGGSTADAAGASATSTSDLTLVPVLPSAASTAADSAAVVSDVEDGDVNPGPTAAPPAATCSIDQALKPGATGEQVACLDAQLTAVGFAAAADSSFDATTDAAVRAFQTANSLYVDGIVGRRTAEALGIWAGPDGPVAAVDEDCPDGARAAIVDRANQRGWLCADGALTEDFKLTSAWSQPDPGTYEVYAKDLKASSTISGSYSTMTHFVAFTRGKYKGARIAFHSMPKDSDGNYLQPLDSLGTEEAHGLSAGCIRVHPDTAVMIWDWLAIGDSVRVIS
jgi:peptidoglycan hydrolase-like protein with peptidoglycan-binding domain